MHDVALFTLAALLIAQEPTPIRITTRLVQVNVIVRLDGKPVTNLTPTDFELLDAGKPVRIALFSKHDRPHAAPASARLPAGMISNRSGREAQVPDSVTVVLLDALNTASMDQAYARDQLLKFLESLRAEDRVAVYTLGTQLKVLHDFTRDFEQLRRTVARFRREPVSADAANPDWFISPEEVNNPVLIEGNERIAEMENVRRISATISALEAIARHLSGIPGRKNLVWVSGSFPMRFGPWNEQPGPRQQAMADPQRDVNAGRLSANAALQIQRATRALSTAGIAVYPVDARGLLGPPGWSAVRSRAVVDPRSPMAGLPSFQPVGIETLQVIAKDTGGKAFYNTNDLGTAMREAVDDSQVSYTLGFYARELDDRYHPIQVRVKRKDVEVRHRRGYQATSAEPNQGRTQELEVRNALSSPLDETAIGLLGNVLKEGSEWHVGYAIEAADIAVDGAGGEWRAELELAIAQQAADGRVLDLQRETLALRLKPDEYQKFRAKIDKDGLVLWKALAPKKDTATVRVVVHDRLSTLTGSLRLPVPR